jgi:ribosomal protein S27AE
MDLLIREDVDFVLDFNCPKCGAPVVIAFEAQEFHMADMRYRPVEIIETLE